MTIQNTAIYTTRSSCKPDNCVRRWSALFIFCSLLFVLVATLYPFSFYMENGWSLRTVFHGFDLRPIASDSLIDLPKNVLLFIPLGIAVSCWLWSHGATKSPIYIVAAMSGLILSITLEITQISLTGRTASIRDVVANASGMAIGFLICWRVRNRVSDHVAKLDAIVRAHLGYGRLIVASIGYVMLFLVLSIGAQNAANLSNWDPSYRLFLGNEATGDRPWHGNIAELYIVDRSLSKIDVVTYLTTGKPTDTITGAPEFLSCLACTNTSDRLLSDSQSVGLLIDRIAQTSQFSVMADIKSARTTQTGPARIISISKDPFHRNFTMAQEGSDLVVRIRTRTSGENGMMPELRVPKVFADAKPHRIVVTYTSPVLRIYIDDMQHVYALALAPGIVLLRTLLRFLPTQPWSIPLRDINVGVYGVIYYGILCLPLGIILVLGIFATKA